MPAPSYRTCHKIMSCQKYTRRCIAERKYTVCDDFCPQYKYAWVILSYVSFDNNSFSASDPTIPNVQVTRMSLVCESSPKPLILDLQGSSGAGKWVRSKVHLDLLPYWPHIFAFWESLCKWVAGQVNLILIHLLIQLPFWMQRYLSQFDQDF